MRTANQRRRRKKQCYQTVRKMARLLDSKTKEIQMLKSRLLDEELDVFLKLPYT